MVAVVGIGNWLLLVVVVVGAAGVPHTVLLLLPLPPALPVVEVGCPSAGKFPPIYSTDIYAYIYRLAS